MSDSSSRGIRHYLRTRTRHEDDFLPIINWFLIAHAVGIVAHMIAARIIRWYGVEGTTTVKIVGGGAVSHETMELAGYYAMPVQFVFFLAVFAAFWVRDYRHP